MSGIPELFMDWSAATGAPLTAGSVTRFLQDVDLAPSGVATLVRWLRQHLHEDVKQPPCSSRVRVGDQWLHVDEAIRRMPVTGTAGVVGRRDAFIVALREAGATKGQVSSLTIADLAPPEVAGGFSLPVGDDWRTCRRCVFARWLQVLAYLPPGGSRLTARNVIATLAPQHSCHLPPPSNWDHALTPLPAIDQHGWPSLEPLTPRSIARITAARMTSDARDSGPPPAPGQVVERVDREEVFAQLNDLLDELEGKLAQVNLDHGHLWADL